MFKLRLWMFIILAISCGKKSSKIDPDNNVPGDNRYYENRIVTFLENGFVVSKGKNGELHDQGDSLLFTGLLLGALPCEQIQTILDAFERMQDHFNGFLVRIDPLPDEYLRDENFISRDGASGALYGLIRASKRCPESSSRISLILSKWEDAVGDSLLLHPKSKAIITPSFKVFWRLAHGKGINTLEYELYMASTLITAKLIEDNKSACYPIHLETIQNLVFEIKGRPILRVDKDKWCAITKDMGLMLTDWYCDRHTDQLKLWMKNPEISPNVYMHQRCTWESPDGVDILSPRVDYLLLYRHILEGSDPWLLELIKH